MFFFLTYYINVTLFTNKTKNLPVYKVYYYTLKYITHTYSLINFNYTKYFISIPYINLYIILLIIQNPIYFYIK